MRLEVSLPAGRRLALAVVGEDTTVDDVRQQCQKKIRRINQQNNAHSSQEPMCEMPILSLRLRSGAELDQTDRVQDLIAAGDTLVANYLQLTALSDELLAKIFAFVNPGRDLLITVPSVCSRFRKICKRSMGAELDLRWLTVWPNKEEAWDGRCHPSRACQAWDGRHMHHAWQKELFYGSCCTANLKLGLEKLNALLDRFSRVKAITLGPDGLPPRITEGHVDHIMGMEEDDVFGESLQDFKTSDFCLGPLRLDSWVARTFENRSIESVTITGRTTFGHEHADNSYMGAVHDPSPLAEQQILRSMASYCPNLRNLILIDVDYSTTDASLADVRRLCPSLTTLTVHWRSTLLALLHHGPVPQLKLFAGSSPGKLEHLDLRCITERLSALPAAGGHPEGRCNAPVIGNETLTAIANNCPRLRTLRLQDVKGSPEHQALAVDKGLREIATRLSHLEVLRLHLESAAPADVAAIVLRSSQLKDVHSHTGILGVDKLHPHNEKDFKDTAKLNLPITHFKMSVADWLHFEFDVGFPPAFGIFPKLSVLDFRVVNIRDFDTQEKLALLRDGLVHAVKWCQHLRKILVGSEQTFLAMLPIQRELPGVTIAIRPLRPRDSVYQRHRECPSYGGIENWDEQTREDLQYTW